MSTKAKLPQAARRFERGIDESLALLGEADDPRVAAEVCEFALGFIHAARRLTDIQRDHVRSGARVVLEAYGKALERLAPAGPNCPKPILLNLAGAADPERAVRFSRARAERLRRLRTIA